MSNAAINQIAMVSSASQPAMDAQPTAQQIARFEQQLETPGGAAMAYYQAPSPDGAGSSGNWRVVLNDMGRIAEQYRVDAAALDDPAASAEIISSRPGGAADSARSAEIYMQSLSKLSHMSFTMMNISWVSAAERLAGENVRSLYQLG